MAVSLSVHTTGPDRLSSVALSSEVSHHPAAENVKSHQIVERWIRGHRIAGCRTECPFRWKGRFSDRLNRSALAAHLAQLWSYQRVRQIRTPA